MPDELKTIHMVVHVPDHAPRAQDPHYKDFEAAKQRLIDQGIYKCVVCGTGDNVELHHSHVEFCLMNAIDVQALDEALGLQLTEDEFAAWVDSPGNLEPLCVDHHRGAHGIHVSPEPVWESLRLVKPGYDLFDSRGNI